MTTSKKGALALIKACPFCGRSRDLFIMDDTDADDWHVSCLRCDVTLRGKQGLQDAIDRWNQRVPTEEP